MNDLNKKANRCVEWRYSSGHETGIIYNDEGQKTPGLCIHCRDHVVWVQHPTFMPSVDISHWVRRLFVKEWP